MRQLSAWPAAAYLLSASQLVHDAAPAFENVPALHVVILLPPSHFPPAGHVAHDVRVALVPPLVYEPGAHTWQLSALPAAENLMSMPQFVQDDAPALENVPAGQVVMTLVPSHLEPAAHVVHVSRVRRVPPEVNDPALHVRHLSACPAFEYRLSAPHCGHVHAPFFEKVPAAQLVTMLLPWHLLPAGQIVHVSRVLVPLPPLVNEPRVQILHLACPACEYLSSAPQFVHAEAPAVAKVPLGHTRRMWPPSQRWPLGQVVQAVRVLASLPLV